MPSFIIYRTAYTKALLSAKTRLNILVISLRMVCDPWPSNFKTSSHLTRSL